MSWAAVVSGRARPTSSTPTTTTPTSPHATRTAHATVARNNPPLSHSTPAPILQTHKFAKPPVAANVPPPSTTVTSNPPTISTGPVVASPTSDTPLSASLPPCNSPPTLSISSEGSPNQLPVPTNNTNNDNSASGRSRLYMSGNKSASNSHHHHHDSYSKHRQQTKKAYRSHKDDNYAHANSTVTNVKRFNNYNNQTVSQSPSQPRRTLTTCERQPSLRAQSPSNNTNSAIDMQSIWADPRILSIYGLWKQHIAFFMTQPSHFFGIFVTNPMFRQSVFEAGLTFHPDTDPSHPVLINLNCSRFGMAERISALAPPVGIDLTGTNAPPMLPQTVVPVSTPATMSMPRPESPHTAMMPMHPMSAPMYLTPPMGNYDTGIPLPIDSYTGRHTILPESMDPYAMSDNSPGADDVRLTTQLSGLKVYGSDTESERLSDGDHKHVNGTVHPVMHATRPLVQSRLRNSHRKEPLRDGRRKVMSRVLDIFLPPSPICKQQSDKAKVELIEQIQELFPTITPPPQYPTSRDDLTARLRAIIAQEWPGADIHVYGSAGNGLGLRSADVDMSLYMPKGVGVVNGLEIGRADFPKVTLARLATLMEQNNVSILGKFLDARVPVIKMLDPVSKLQVDVCVNNMLAVRNTELLKAYVDLDERFRYVCILVKLWAKRRDLNDAYHGTLSSYAYTLLVIHYLQTLETPVLPCLQNMVDGKVITDGKLPCEMTDNGGSKLYNTYFDRTVCAKTFKSENMGPVHELLLGFFHYYAYVFQYRTDLVSIRLGVQSGRNERGWDEQTVYDEWEEKNAHYKAAMEAARAAFNACRKADDDEQRLRAQASAERNGKASSNECDAMPVLNENGIPGVESVQSRIQYPRRPRLASKHLFCIEDPFDIDHDLSRGMEKAAVTVIKQEMMRAYEIIAETGDFEAACEEYG